MLSVQNEQTKEKTELQKGDEKESEIIPDDKEYKPSKLKGILFLFFYAICVILIIANVDSHNKGIDFYFGQCLILFLGALYFLWFEGFFF